MSVIDDFSRFLEARLEEFLKANPQLELQVLEDKVREQVQSTRRLMVDLQAQEKQLEADILSTAQEIKRWHQRLEKAQAAGRQDLVQAATEREAMLLRQGNQLWGQMEVMKERLRQTAELEQKMQTRLQEVQDKRIEADAAAKTQFGQESAKAWDAVASDWSQPGSFSDPDPVEEKFRRWEMDEELEQLKRNL